MYRNIFISAIHSKKKVRITYLSPKDISTKTRVLAPLDLKEGKYHAWNFECREGGSDLHIPENDVLDMQIINEDFEPTLIVKGEVQWVFQRKWE
jgi:hypothetical protein